MVPQYLLNTTLGSEYAASHRDRVPPHDLAIRIRLTQDNLGHTFSENPALDAMIEKKLKYKLAAFDLLGENPFRAETDRRLQRVSPELAQQEERLDREKLLAMYAMVQEQLIDDDRDAPEATEATEERAVDTAAKRPPFRSDRIGEIYMNETAFGVHGDDVDLGLIPIKQLILSARFEKYSRFFPRRPEDQLVPTRWIPLCLSRDITRLSDLLGLEVSGPHLSTITLTTKDYKPAAIASPENASCYVNFVGDRTVDSRLGLFYYEVQVTQECNSASNFRPIISITDSVLSFALAFSMGYTCEAPVLESESSHNTADGDRVDISNVLQILRLYSVLQQPALRRVLDRLAALRPGVTEGTFAVSFKDRVFHDSISNPLNPRSLLTMNRRLSPLHRQLAEENDTERAHLEMISSRMTVADGRPHKVCKTDTIGCGVDFISKSVFITFNGIRVKDFDETHLSPYNPLRQEERVDLFPVFGFSVAHFNEIQPDGEPTTVTIKTNLGLEPFKFDINSYSQQLKQRNEQVLNHLSAEVQLDTPKMPLVLQQDLDQSLVSVIRSHLANGAFLDTLAAFEEDTTALGQWDEGLRKDSQEFVERSRAQNRKAIKALLLNSQFDEALDAMVLFVSTCREDQIPTELAFKVKFMKYKSLVRTHIQKKAQLHDEFTFQERPQASLKRELENTINYGRALLADFSPSDDDRHDILRISSLLFHESQEAFADDNYKQTIGSYAEHLRQLAWHVNEYLVKTAMGAHLEHGSKLDVLCRDVEFQIHTLATRLDDKRFQMINFERDLVDI